MFPIVLALFFFCCSSSTDAKFSADFNQFLSTYYGVGMQRQLERADLGDGGSFGGRSSPGEVLSKRAVLLVHGITNRATTFIGTADYFVSQGYSRSEIYATTWGDAGRTPTPLVDMSCAYVKQVRNMIIAVRQYTGRNIDVIGYSMGSPIARKAILGGYCVDTEELLGPSLTGMIETFVGVAGANFGSSLCVFPIPGTCNQKTGLSCGSQFLNDINRQSQYEGRYIFAIYSTDDDVVGYQTCGQITSSVPGMNSAIQKTGLKHDAVVKGTSAEQFNFIVNHQGGTVGRPPVAAGGGGPVQMIGRILGGASGIAGLLSRLG